jgi:hypothetical protein
MVSIVQLDRGFSVWCWLCPKHLKARQKAGWDLKATKKPPHPLTCDDCVDAAVVETRARAVELELFAVGVGQ